MRMASSFSVRAGGGHVVNKHVPEFDKVMKTGAGLSCLHYGVEVPIGPSAKGMLNWAGGYFEANWSVNPHWVAEFKSFSKHPVANGVKPFKSDDEWYFHMRFQQGMRGCRANPVSHRAGRNYEAWGRTAFRKSSGAEKSRCRRTATRRLGL